MWLVHYLSNHRIYKELQTIEENEFRFREQVKALTAGSHLVATESEAESETEVQGALWSSVNPKAELEAESEARQNRIWKDQKSFVFFQFHFCFHHFRYADSH